jgi:Peptidase family M1 domain
MNFHSPLKTIYILLFSLYSVALIAQPERWQQRVEYVMDVDFDVTKNQFTGTQKLTYFNNSPDTLYSVFYHLYFNAFQPNSMMDTRSRQIADPDPRVASRILALSDKEIGFQKIKQLTQNGKPLRIDLYETIAKVTLTQPILPNTSTVLEMQFNGQIPLQVRRSGRDSKEGIAYSMTQWYPKIAEYDYQGWHANPYIAREFYGVWGNFDVTIHLDKKYLIGASAILLNPEEIGKGYETAGMKVNLPKGNKLNWHFKAENVHDFAWAADPDYTHTQIKMDDGVNFHFIYQKSEKNGDAWAKMPEAMKKIYPFACKNFGQYPYPQFSVIQGGDGGMEYPMSTLITGERPYKSLLGVTIHEMMHSWYQGVLGSNESLYAWMDEGFTSYASDRIEQFVFDQNSTKNAFEDTYKGYFNLIESGREEPLSTHADHFNTNFAYSLDAYTKGAVFMNQLEYILGKPVFEKALLRYFNTWKFKHPNPNDCIRVFEKESGLELDWYKEEMLNTLNTIDYSIANVEKEGKNTKITLERKGKMPMPIDVVVTYQDGSQDIFNIPLTLMYGNKVRENMKSGFEVQPSWAWVNPTYSFTVNKSSKILTIEIDPSQRMADIDRTNNVFLSEK